MTPTDIVDRLEVVIGLQGEPCKLTASMEIELVGHFGLPAIQASERAEKVSPAVARIIAQRSAKSETDGTVGTLVLLGSTSDIIAGYCHILPTDIANVASAKKQRIQAGTLLKAMRALSFNDFEKFGARVLKEIGASFSHITPHGGDQGIDFYGRLSLGQFQDMPMPFMKLAHDVVLLFAGQAKHYPEKPIGPDIVRELVGAVSLARTKTFSKENLDLFPGLNLKPFSPLVTLLFTTGRITSGAAQLAESAGIIARSGEQLAVFLADKGIGMKQTDAGAVFDEDKFSEWLNPKVNTN